MQECFVYILILSGINYFHISHIEEVLQITYCSKEIGTSTTNVALRPGFLKKLMTGQLWFSKYLKKTFFIHVCVMFQQLLLHS